MFNDKIRSIYIHIPFCNKICSYCDFCKMYYSKKWVINYLNELENEISQCYKNEKINTIYIGGGTPSCLTIEELKKLFNIVKKINLDNNYEFTFECNINDLNYEKLKLLYENGVNRLSIGVQTLNKKLLKVLNRNHSTEEVFEKIKIAKQIGFNNINIDIIYAIPGQTFLELKKDIENILKLDVQHISTYSLIIEPNTQLYINNIENIDEELDYKMYEFICSKLEKNGFIHYEVSNFGKKGFFSKHNLTYWNNLNYYGFGLGASGYVDNVRYDNTKSLNKYLKGNYRNVEHVLTHKETIENEFILGLRKIKGINKKEFYKKYGDIKKNKVVKEMIDKKDLIEDEDSIYINPKYIYTSNRILVKFIDS